MKLGLALSGGGVRGAVHIGVLKALEDNNIKIDIIGGTSSGSLVAVLYAMGYSPIHIYNLFKRYAKNITQIEPKTILNSVGSYIISKKISIAGINNGKTIEKIYNDLANKKGIYKMRDLKMPIVIPTTDINDGEEYIFTNKIPNNENNDKYITDVSIGTAVRASCSFPGIFIPYKFKNHMFLDGGTVDNIPIKQVKFHGADKVIIVCFEAIKISNRSNMIDIVLRTIDIMGNKILEKDLRQSDFIIKVPTENNIGFLDINQIEKCFKQGYDITTKNIKNIKLIH